MPERVFSLSSRIYFDRDALKTSLPFLSSIARRCVLITESVLKTDSQAYMIRDLLRKNGIDTVLYDGIPSSGGNLPLDVVRFIRSSRADAVIGFGGIRTLSVARWAALQAVDQDPAGTGGSSLPFIAFPSTCRNPFLFSPTWYLSFSRTGSDVYEISGNETHAVVMEPSWSRTLPPRYSGTAILASVLDGVEGLFGKTITPLCESLLSQSIRTLCSSLVGVLEHPEDERFREISCAGGLLSAMGLASVRLGPVGALSLVLDARYGIPKSWSATVLLPHLLESRAEDSPERCAKIAGLLGIVPEGMEVRETAQYASALARDLLGLLDMPLRFTSFELTDPDLEKAAQEAASILRNAGVSSFLRETDLLLLLRQAN